MNITIDYYNENADNFISHTINVDFLATQKRFQEKLSVGAKILDFGCGSGRDTKYFLSQGYDVYAIDGSEELCKFASDYTGIKVQHMLFQDLSEVNIYDGIWACASILHLKKTELPDIFRKMIVATKNKGILYVSFKYSEFEGNRNGRYFTDMTEMSFNKFIKQFPELKIEDMWITGDVRQGRGDEKWLNLILRKQ